MCARKIISQRVLFDSIVWTSSLWPGWLDLLQKLGELWTETGLEVISAMELPKLKTAKVSVPMLKERKTTFVRRANRQNPQLGIGR